MTEFKLLGHEPSFLPDGYEWQLAWHDEFDGTQLDMTKWDHRYCMMGKRHMTWQPEGVSLDGKSNCVFKIFEKDGMICSSQLQTGYNYMDEPNGDTATYGKTTWPIGKLKKSKYLHRYGYYECRCRLQQKNGWWSAFWLQSPIIGSSLDPEVSGVEVDIMESFSAGRIIPHTNHYDGYGVDHKSAKTGGDCDISTDEFHRFGVLWDENGYSYYIDGKLDGHIAGPVSHIPQFILISTEVNGYRSDPFEATDEAKAAAVAGDEFIVDYVRVFDRK